MNRYYVLFFLFLCLTSFTFADYSGFTVTSVSTSDVITRTTQPSSVYWLINTNFNGGGQSLTGTLDPNTVKSFMGGKIYTKQPFTVTVSSIDETVFYEVVNQGVQIYKYSYYKEDNPTALGIASGNPAPCTNSNWQIDVGKTTFGYVDMRFCVKKEAIAGKGAYNNPKIDFKAKITVSNGYQSIEKQVCSGASLGCTGTSVDLEGIGTAQWTGSLVTGDAPPNQNLFVAVNKYDTKKWQIAGESYWSDYKSKENVADGILNNIHAQATQGYFTDWSTTDAAIQSAISPINQASYILTNQDTSFTSGSFSKDSNSGKVSITLGRKLTSPNVIFRIRADWIGIVIPTGKPKIISATSNKMASGESGEVKVQVQNIGDGDGTFSAMLVSCEPFIQTSSGESARKTFQPNNIDTLSIGLSGGVSTDNLAKSCAVKVYDINDPTIYDQYSLYLQQEKPKICVPNQVIAEGSIIKKCNIGGTSLDVVDTCQYSVISDGKGGFACASPPEKQTTTGSKPKSQCNSDADCSIAAFCSQDIHVCVQRSGCINVRNSGDSNTKIDVAFVGDGYLNNDELQADVQKIVDYDSQNNGLMSVEPFKSNRAKFNIWMIRAGNLPVTIKDNRPVRGAALDKAAECAAADSIVILSKNRFRSFAYIGAEAYLSLGSYSSSEWGRLFLHEFGHSFGQLADEYVEPPTNWPHKPNCAPDISTAQSWWGNVPNTGYYQGCSYIDGNVRPTFNSIMRLHWILKDDYGPVNSAALTKILERYR